MKKSEAFDRILAKTCEECEISVDSVLAGVKLQAVVNARCIAVYCMRKAGFSNDDIALIVLRKMQNDMSYYPPLKSIKSKAKGIDKEYYSYFVKYDQMPMFRLMSDEVRSWCLKQLEELSVNF